MQPNEEQHLFWQYLPPERKTRRARWILSGHRLLAWSGGQRQRICIFLGLYILLWSLPLVFGQPMISVFALLPLLLVPPVGLLVYRLVWMEFHE